MLLVRIGSDHGLSSRSELGPPKRCVHNVVKPMVLNTAGGPTRTIERLQAWVDEFGESVGAVVVDDTPAVLSVGRRCNTCGYSCAWPTGEEHVFVTIGADHRP